VVEESGEIAMESEERRAFAGVAAVGFEGSSALVLVALV